MTDNTKAIDYINMHTGGQRMYATLPEQQAIIQACGEPAVILYEYYLSKRASEFGDLVDKKVARTFCWSEKKAQQVRLKLKKAGWIDQELTTNSAGTYKSTVYFLGLIKVLEYRIKVSKPKKTIVDVVNDLNGLAVKYTDKQKHTLLIRWLKAGYIVMAPFEQKAFDENPIEFVEKFFKR